MPALFIYLIKVNVALLIFCAGYYAVLRHLTFYNLNRVYLVTAIIFSTLYPKVNLSNFLNRHEEIAKPIQVVIVNWQEPVKTITKTFLGRDVWFWLQAAFWTGVILFAIRLAMQLLSLYRLHKRSEPAQLHHYVIRVIKGNINPFSFWRNIYINPDNHPTQELNAILEHEHIHVSEWHTIDILLGEVSAIFYWFNPGVWLMKRAIRENIEFITDNKILLKGVDSKAYQYSLLNVNFGAQGNAIVNHFNISTIKKRIIMMNAKRSSKVNITRYLFLIPVVMCLLLVFSVSKAELNKVVKSSTHMMRTLKTVVNSITLINVPASNTPARKRGPVLAAISHLSIQSDTVTDIQDLPRLKLQFKSFFFNDTDKNDGKIEVLNIMPSDTNKRIFKIRLNGNDKPDYYLNGVKTELALEAIDPNSIATVDVHKDLATSPNSAVYITTKGHEIKGSVGVNRIYLDTALIKGKLHTRTVSGILMTGSGGGRGISTAGKPTTLTVVTHADTKGNVVSNDTVYTSGAVAIARPSTLSNEVVVRGYPTKVSGVGARNVVTVNGYSTGVSGVSTGKSATVIGDLTNLLIIIDGKETTKEKFNKLPAGDIQSISVLKDEAAKIYGDKGKNGVLVITTKKKG
jgi:bla regulator protein BlaR1